ncbi:SCO4225 family membrane protein [Kitasatospora sp. KL5]|uniref:SCO4225 family membrane protein n=1 Tax=Kitasatospora sp. KL5 TaxID=3425125 RepID=UPI003D6E696F
MASDTDTRPRRIPAPVAPAFDNMFSLAYLALVAAAVGLVVHANYVLHDPAFANLWLALATAPAGLLALPLPAVFWDTPVEWIGPPLLIATTATAALVNAAFLGRLVAGIRATARSGRTAG